MLNINKIEDFKSGMSVTYTGKNEQFYGKTGVFQRMIEGTTAAKVDILGTQTIFDINNLKINETDTVIEEYHNDMRKKMMANDHSDTISTYTEAGVVNMTALKEVTQSRASLLPTEITFDIAFKQPEITFDEEKFKASIDSVIMPVKELGTNLTKEILTTTLAKLRKFQKEISDRRIAIVKEIKTPITELEAKIKKGDAQIEQYIVKYDAELKVITAKEKISKQQKIEPMINAAIAINNLNIEYAKQLIILEDYFLAKWSLDKIEVDINQRAQAIFKMQDYERVQAELKNTQIESRTRLIEWLNGNYQCTFTYAKFPIEKFTDEEVNKFYAEKEREVLAIKSQQEADNINQKNMAPERITIDCHNDIPHIISPVDVFNLEAITPNPELIYQNLRLGGANQAHLMQAVAKLKADGLSVEFI